MDSGYRGKMDELFRQIWLLEQRFSNQPSPELARTLVEHLSRVGSRGYFNPVLGVSWMPASMAEKRLSYQRYIESQCEGCQEG
ncbi:MAG: hypothetical protein P4N59_06670 [Negativicutes bacterium]|nr:hypothetical protein [Negativicutes bacterium]